MGVIDLFAEERRLKIADMIKNTKSITVSELARTFGVSESTIRRDLQFLEDQGYIQRTHGGAILQHSHYEPTYLEKESKEAASKKEIGILSSKLVKDGDTILLDSGTTTLSIARNLKGKRITVVTNSPVIAMELFTDEDIEVILVGGIFRKETRALVGPIAEKNLKEFKVDKAFIGANGVALDGITTPNIIEATTKRVMIEISSQPYIVADHTKFGISTFVRFANLSDIAAIITDRNVDLKWVTSFEEAGTEIIHPEKG
nr:DeoR/GlpR family DNA-binding transcription regulator [Thermosediminibacter litoriperuensis]